MAAEVSKPVKEKKLKIKAPKLKAPKVKASKGKAIRGRMPVKRSINLILINENKINPLKAILGILLIVVLAVLFSKYLVADRLIAMSTATSQTQRLRTNLDDAYKVVKSYGDVEQTYAHYTMADMTSTELGLVDRTRVLELVKTLIPKRNFPELLAMARERCQKLTGAYRDLMRFPVNVEAFLERLEELRSVPFPPRDDAVRSWTVNGNVLVVEMTSYSLERLNLLGHGLEDDPIVNTCVITTAKKDIRRQKQEEEEEDVTARFTVYLQQPPEEEVAKP